MQVSEVHHLVRGVMDRYVQPDGGQVGQARTQMLAIVEPGNVRDKAVDQEHAGLVQVRCDVRKAPDLLILGSEHEERVGDDEDEREAAFHVYVCEVSHGNRHGLSASLGPELIDHCLGRVYPVDLDPSGGEGKRIGPCPNPQLQSPASAASPARKPTRSDTFAGR